ncbi:MAG TPA: glycosyltransferase family 39 protein [Bryobacteraceae bacterium]|nr:glycosyltransferase family 39 protein [Bryobacteraceae bacterium]
MIRSWRSIATVTLLYAAIVTATHYTYFGDTNAYIANILAFDRDPGAGRQAFWDFGHLWWRPLGWLLFRAFGGLIPYGNTGEYNLSVAVLLIAVNVVSGLITVLLLRSVAARFLSPWTANLVAVAFLCFHAFLNYIQTGAPYIIGLLWLTLSIWSAIRIAESNAQSYAWLSGIAAALSVLFWFPYIVALPGLLVLLFLWPSDRSTRRFIPVVVAAASLVAGAAYLLAMTQLHIHSVADLRQWITASSHGWAQNRRLFRLATGLPRSFLWIGDTGMLIKRYVLHDPYAPVSISQIIFQQLWRVAIFYVFAVALAVTLFREVKERWVLWITLAAAVPVLFFAVVIFEPGSTERYLPLYPFLCIAVSYALSRIHENRVAATAIAAFLALAVVLNVAALWRGSVMRQYERTSSRASSLNHRVTSKGLVAVVSQFDDLYLLTGSFPFDPVSRLSLPIYDVVGPASDRVRTWKQDFARLAVNAQSKNEAVWVSKRLLAVKPAPEWGWNEGDDPRISWKDLPPFFSGLEYCGDVGGPDGFLQVANSANNQQVLTAAAN